MISVVTDPRGQSVTDAGHFEIVWVDVMYAVEVMGLPVWTPPGALVTVASPETGQTVVYTSMTIVVRDLYGQFVTVGAHW